MPELPEVETVKLLVDKRVCNKRIKKIKVLNPKLRWPIDISNMDKLKNKSINQVTRRGKYILLEIEDSSQVLIIHLGMTGVIRFTDIGSLTRQKHDHLLIFFDDFILVYNDTRKFGSIHITKDISSMFLLRDLGLEPLSIEFTDQYLLDVAKSRKCTVKDLIMNQRIVVGVGNIYATESLFLSKINPAICANEIKKYQYKELVHNIKLVLSKSIKMGGSTIKDFVNAEGKPGYFSQELLVYQKKYCPFHKKHLLSNIKISGRSSFYCSKCQPLSLRANISPVKN